MLTRDEAFKLIANHIENGSVPRSIVQQVLGEKKYRYLLNDKIKNNGWTPDSVYYLNVVDYMCMPEPPDEEESVSIQNNPLTLKDVLLLLDDLISKSEKIIHQPDDPSGCSTQYEIDSEKMREEIQKRLNEMGESDGKIEKNV